MIAAHKANVCPYEVVDCPFSVVGCNEHVLRKDVESHEEAAMKKHNRLLLQGMQTQQQDIQLLRQDNLSLQQKVAEQEKRLDGQSYELVYKVKLTDLVRGGEVVKCSDDKMVGAYKSYVHVQKGYADTGDCCGVYLGLKDGPFPCRVYYTIEVVHWDGKIESARKKEYTNMYDAPQGRGPSKFIPLSKLTAAASPYVNDGEVTFIITFRILPVV